MIRTLGENLEELAWWVLVIGILEVGLILLAVIWALTYSARLPAPALLVVALVLVIMILLLVFALSNDARAAEVLALVGVPVGALVAASTSIYSAHQTIQNMPLPLEDQHEAQDLPAKDEDEGA